jgi:hypothetical protein
VNAAGRATLIADEGLEDADAYGLARVEAIADVEQGVAALDVAAQADGSSRSA